MIHMAMVKDQMFGKGLAQINGRDVLAGKIEKKAWFDGEYAKKITFWGDVKILFRTVLVVLREDGIEEGHAEKQSPALEEAAPTQDGEKETV